MTDQKYTADREHLRREIESAINRCSMERGSNTPDFLLAEYLMRCFDAFTIGVNDRATWYRRHDVPGQSEVSDAH